MGKEHTITSQFIAWGEILLRLSPPGYSRLFQTNMFEAYFGGAEANCAVTLSQVGIPCRIVSALPDTVLGDAAKRYLQGFGVITDNIVMKQDTRMGLYFYEQGAGLRASRLIYDRNNSAFAQLQHEDINWNAIIPSNAWFHTKGITLALSNTICDESIKAASIVNEKKGVVSFDINYRQTLWKSVDDARDAFLRLMPSIHVLIGNEEHLALFLLPNSEKKHDIHSTIQALFNTYANLSAIVITYREGTSASEVRVGAAAATRNHEVAMKTLEVPHIVDRIGAGDALAAGFIYSLIQQQSLETAVDNALALCGLAHSVHGDNFIVGKADVEAILQNKSSRLLR